MEIIKNGTLIIGTFLMLNISFVIQLNAQVGINNDNSSPNVSAMLDVKSTDKGMLIPRLTTIQRDGITTPATGLMIYNTTNNLFNFYNGTSWIEISGSTVNSIVDADNDTKIQVEKTADEDIIRFDIIGSERIVINQSPTGATQLNFPNNNQNTFVGTNAGIANTTAVQNTFLGFQTGNSTATGGNNTFIGSEAGFTNTGGYLNTFTGMRAGYLNTTGYRNTFTGAGAGIINTTGSRNMFSGYESGRFNTTGWYNTFSGYNAGYANSTGSNNTALGKDAGYSNSTGSSNIFLGHQAGYNETGSDKLYIENTNSLTPLIYGDFANDTVKIYGTLGIKDAYHFPIVDGTIGQVLKTNGTGQLTWATASINTDNQDLSLSGNILSLTNDGTTVDLNSIDILADTDNNTKIQVEKTTNDDNIRFEIQGIEMLTFRKNANGNLLVQTNDPDNTFYGSGVGINNTGNQNNFFGGQAGFNNTTGYDNSFFGRRAGFNNLTGGRNTFIGAFAGYGNTTGSSNVCIGELTGAGNTTGSFNILIGDSAGHGNATGVENIFIGTAAGSANTGSNNLFLGYFAGSNETGNNKLIIDNNGNTPLIYGEFDNNLVRINNKLEIGDGTTLGEFNLRGNTMTMGYVNATNDDVSIQLGWGNATSKWEISTATSGTYGYNGALIFKSKEGILWNAPLVEQMRIDYVGRVGIGRVPTTNLLEVEGDASKSTAGNWIANSDARLKKNIQSLSSEKMLNNLLALQGVTYEWNDTTTGTNRPLGIQYGFIAQNIEQVFPTLVDEDNLGYLQTAYGTYDAMTVEAIRALNDKIEKLELKNEQLEKDNEFLKVQSNKINQLEVALQQLMQDLQASSKANISTEE